MAFVTRTMVKALRLYERETIGVVWNRPGIERTFGSLGVSAIKVVSQAFWMGALLLFVIGCYFSSRQGFASFACHPAIATLKRFSPDLNLARRLRKRTRRCATCRNTVGSLPPPCRCELTGKIRAVTYSTVRIYG